ncbi:MAG: tetratricopeptide repeat protein [Desulfobacterales bacterium]|nr:tetratricopeptide repeat protein [Desulfobacterales bacterium]
MRAIRPVLIAVSVLACLACAAAPAKPRLPEGTRKSIYFTNRGPALFNKGCHRRALDYFQSAHQRYTAADNLEMVAEALNGIGDIYYRLGDMPSALHVYDDAIEIYQNLEDDPGMALALEEAVQSGIYFALGHLDLTENRPAAAQQHFAEALRIDRLMGACHDMARDLEALGNCDVGLDDHRAAVHHFKRSAKIFALLQEKQRAESVLYQLEASAARADLDIQATAHWVRQWLADPAGAELCH